MSQRHRRNDAHSSIENPGWASHQQALQDIREACLFGRESILTKMSQQSIEYDTDESPKEEDPDPDVILECLKQVQQICFFLIERQKNDPQANVRGELLQLRQVVGQFSSISRMNEQNMLIGYRTLNQLAETMKQFSNEIRPEMPQTLQQNFAELHDVVVSLSSTLYNYRSSGQEFNQEKEFWMTKNNQALEASATDVPANINSAIAEETEQASSRVSNKSQQEGQQSPVTETNQHTRKGSELPLSTEIMAFQEAEKGRNDEESNQLRMQNQTLQQALVELESLLEKNNAEFSEEVQKYNTLLYQQQHELKECERAIRTLEGRIHQLEETNLSLRQQRFRDELMIENMARKLRLHERQRPQQLQSSLRNGRSVRSISPNNSLFARPDPFGHRPPPDVFHHRPLYKAASPRHFQQQFQH